tara:strand:+ start:1269 stop:1535 length:267 start_codon:yes stop_codon:yes gene_type:complete
MQKFTIIGLLTISMVAIAAPTLAKDHHSDRNQHDSYQNSRQSDRHADHNKRTFQGNNKKHYSDRNAHNDYSHKRYSEHSKYNYSANKH